MLFRLLAASVAGGIAMFALGFVVYGLVLDPMVMKPNMVEYPGLMKEMPVFVPLILGNIVNAFYLAFIFEKWGSIRTFVGGMKAGAIIMCLVSLSFQLMFIAFMNLMKGYLPSIVDVAGTTVIGAVSGGIIGLVLGMMHKNEDSA